MDKETWRSFAQHPCMLELSKEIAEGKRDMAEALMMGPLEGAAQLPPMAIRHAHSQGFVDGLSAISELVQEKCNA